ncbi:MAG: hypothetical protein WCS30_04190 [Selenomonadaceae bacterium]
MNKRNCYKKIAGLCFFTANKECREKRMAGYEFYMEMVWNVFVLTGIELMYLLGVVIAAGFLLGIVESFSNQWAYKAWGRSGILVTSFIGTPIHEAGHALLCILFHHKITAIKFLDLNPQAETLGYVQHSFDKQSLYQRMGTFFISMGPIFSGTASILFFLYFLEPDVFQVLQKLAANAPLDASGMQLIQWFEYSIKVFYGEIVNFTKLGSWQYGLFLFLAISVSSHIALSTTDLKNMMSGLGVIFCVAVLGNAVAALIEVDTLHYVLLLAPYNIYLLSVLSVSILFSLFTACLMGGICFIKRIFFY